MSNELDRARLKKQAQAVCDKTHILLGDPIDQFEGLTKTERIVLNIPEAFTYLSTYLAFVQRNNSNHVPAWEHHEEALKRKYKNERAIMRGFLERLIENTMHQELQQLCQFSNAPTDPSKTFNQTSK